MKGSSNDNGNVSDSGYTNTCVSQSQRSSDNSLSRNTNRSESSGYGRGNPSADYSRNYALPQSISKHRDEEHKTKKSKAATATILGKIATKLGSQINFRQQNEVGTYDSNESSFDLTSNCKKTEIAGVELIDDRGLEDHNGDSNSTETEGGIGTITTPFEDTTSNINAGFCTVISMKKGRIVNVTPSVKSTLGYSRESWIDRSFIEFVHPKDKQTFADCLTKNIALPYGDRDKGPNGHQTSMFCSLLKNDDGQSAMECTSDDSGSPKATANFYVPFRLTTSIKFFRERNSDERSRMMFLIVNAEPIVPVYKGPEEMILSAIFPTQHDRNCILTSVDLNVVQYLGYTPQDMIGRSIFEFYHPEDLPFLKDVYDTVVKMKGSPFRSKPYRFAAQNGDYVVLETEWASFFNPWTEKLEFVVGHHRVLRGPANPNVFQAPGESQRSLLANASEEIFKESKIIQREIRVLLDEKIQRTEDNEECDITSRSKDLDIFVENLLRKVKPPTLATKEHFRADDRGFLEHDSAILGAISPHHEYCDSKSSTETPPSYNQLNYNEKLNRFFDSKLLVTTPYGSDEDNINLSMPSNEEAAKTSSNFIGTKEMTLSAENLSSGSNNRTSYDSREDSDNPRSANTMPAGDLKIPTLTESVLNKHNREMEKLLAQQHKERHCNIKSSNKHNKDAKLNDKRDKSNKQKKDRTKNRGVKRPTTDGREGEHCKVTKYDENAQTCASPPIPAEMTSTPNNAVSYGLSPDEASPAKSSNIWPSSKVTIPSQPTHPHLCMPATNNGMKQQEPPVCLAGFSPMVPIYFVPLPQIRNNFMPPVDPSITRRSLQTNQPQRNTFAPLAGVIYPPIVCAPAPVTTVYQQFVIPGAGPINREMSQPNDSGNVAQPENSADGIKRPASQATSVKAEPGSITALSESSKKLHSLGKHFSSCVSVDGGCSNVAPNAKRGTDTNSEFDSSLEDSSDSSFYGSFLTTSIGSSCNQKPKNAEHPRQKSPWKATTARASTNSHKEPLNMLRKGPPWQEGVKMIEELIYQYQLVPKPLNEVLEADMKVLKSFDQPEMVNDQLAQLYSDMQVDTADFFAERVLCEHEASADSESGSSGDDPRYVMPESNGARSGMNFTKMTMIYEENAPLPEHHKIHETSI